MTHLPKSLTVLAALGMLAAPAALSTPAAAASDSHATLAAGMLTCRLADDTNLVLFSTESYDCSYAAANGETGAYRGEIRKLGADLSLKRDQVLKWAVLAPSGGGGAGAIAGSYIGGSAEATVGAGLGARALIGGSDSQFTLQPVSLSGQTGLGVSATLDALALTYLSSARRGGEESAEVERKCYPSGLCDGEDYSKPKEDYS